MKAENTIGLLETPGGFMLYDFHTHTFLSDGVLSPVELIRRAVANGYTAIAVTDHAGIGDQERVLDILVKECEMASAEMGIMAFPGVELTHVPPKRIAEAARKAKSLGAKIVLVHGETIKEPVALGTNQAALESPDVDILVHPGMLTEAEAKLAKKAGIYLELTARAGHSLTNGHVARTALAVGANLVVDSDGHAPGDLLTEELARQVAIGAGLSLDVIDKVLHTNPQAIIANMAN
jgi:histidinol phosphatase-like PHP family hydrolase